MMEISASQSPCRDDPQPLARRYHNILIHRPVRVYFARRASCSDRLFSNAYPSGEQFFANHQINLTIANFSQFDGNVFEGFGPVRMAWVISSKG